MNAIAAAVLAVNVAFVGCTRIVCERLHVMHL